MPKSRLYFIIIALAVIISGLTGYSNPDYLLINPFNNYLNMENASRITADSSGGRYIIYDSSKKVSRIDKNGRVEFILEGNSDKPDRFALAWDITCDNKGNFFILDFTTDASGIKVNKESIKMFSSSGDFIKTVFTHNYDDNKPDMEGNYRKIRFYNDRIFYYYSDYETMHAGSIDPESGENTVLKSINIKEPKLNIVDCDFLPNLASIACITQKGQILLSRYNLEFREIYTSSKSVIKDTPSIPWGIIADGTDVYFSDAGLRRIVKIDTTKKGVEKYSYSGDTGGTVRSFVLTGEGFAAVTDSSIIEGDFNGNITAQTESARYSNIIVLLRWIVFLSGLVFFISFIFLCSWIYVFIFEKNFSEVFVQSMMIITAVLITTIIVLIISVTTLTAMYRENQFNNLKHINQLSDKYIEGDLVKRIKNREDFMNRDYVKVRSQLHSMFNENRDEWNEDYYGGLYTLKNDDIYVLMFFDDSSGVNFPYRENYKDSPFKDVIEKGSIVGVEESDVYGSWIYSLGPVYDSKGNLAAILEVGKDLNTFQVKIKNFIINISKEIITVLIILVLVMIEITILRNVFKNKSDPETSGNPFGRYPVEIVRMLAFIIAFSYALPVSYTPLMMREILHTTGISVFNLPEGIAMALPISAEMLATALFAVFSGSLVEKRGWKTPFLIGSLCMAAGSFIAFYVNDPYAFIIARTFVGAAYGFALVTLQCYPMISPDITVRNNGLASQNSGLNAGYCCGVAIGGLSADYLGFSHVYIFSVMVSIIALMYARYLMSNNRTHTLTEPKKVTASDIFSFFTNRNVFLFFFAAFIPVSICSMFLTYMFPVFAEAQDVTAGDISRVFMLNSLVIIYLGPAIVRFLTKNAMLRGKWTMALYIGVTLAGLLIFALKPGIITAVILVIFIGIGDSFGLPMSNDYLIELKASAEIGYDKTVGYLNFIGNIGQMIGPVLMGYLFLFGYEKGTFIIIAGMTVTFLLFIAFTRNEYVKAGE
jgi:predicted MFS family arabinose efflux permease